MTVLVALLQLLAFAWCIALPGWLLARQLDEDWSWPVRAVVGVSIGMLAVPMSCFVAAWILETSIHLTLVIAVGSLLNVAGGLAWWLRRDA